jgi:CTP-dependent riboflavin kinase
VTLNEVTKFETKKVVKGGGSGSFGVTEKNYEALERRYLGFNPIFELRTSPVNHTRPSKVKDTMSLESGQSSGSCS